MGHEENTILSRTRVIKAGKTLIDKTSPEEKKTEALEILSEWRSYHAKPLDAFQKYIRTRDICVKRKAIIAQRLKRLPSIISKLERMPSNNLARMQDIGGIRVVLPSIADVLALHSEVLIKPNNRFLFTPKMPAKDYITNPKPDGYKSIHQVFEYKRDEVNNTAGLCIELQIRTALQHAFATAVETLGMVERLSFKTGQGSEDFKTFLKLLARCFLTRKKLRYLMNIKKKPFLN